MAEAHCDVCPKRCTLEEGQIGPCLARMGWDGDSEDRSLGWAMVVRDDPIEKKYIFHVNPGCLVRTVGFSGCSLQCPFCQNWELSHVYKIPTTKIRDISLQGDGVRAIAFSYNEPTLNWENVCRLGYQAADQGLFTILNTNGFITQETRERLAWLDVWSIGLKGSSRHYEALGLPGAEACWETAVWVREVAPHVEISVLLYPIAPIEAVWEELSRNGLWSIPIHLQKGFARGNYEGPTYRDEEMIEIWQRAREFSPYVYLHNVLAKGVRDTICPECGEVLVSRPLVRAESVSPCSCLLARKGRVRDALFV